MQDKYILVSMALRFKRSGLLEPGQHHLIWDEFVKTYGVNKHRKALIAQMPTAFRLLRKAGCRTIFMNGSFVINPKVELDPSDYDALFLLKEIPDGSLLDPIFRMQQPSGLIDKIGQLSRFGGEFYAAEYPSRLGGTMFEFFQQDKDTKAPKGIIVLDIRRIR